MQKGSSVKAVLWCPTSSNKLRVAMYSRIVALCTLCYETVLLQSIQNATMLKDGHNAFQEHRRLTTVCPVQMALILARDTAAAIAHLCDEVLMQIADCNKATLHVCAVPHWVVHDMSSHKQFGCKLAVPDDQGKHMTRELLTSANDGCILFSGQQLSCHVLAA